MLNLTALAVLLLALPLDAFAQAPASPYAGQQARDVKALSADDVRDLLEGRGMGLARAAELNRYPGPLHVLELAGPLQLTAAQRAETESVRAAMLREARELGRAIVDKEKELDGLFAGGQAEPARMVALVDEIARMQGTLRATHLRAHLAMRRLLTPEQVAKYGELRGYGSESPGHQSHQHGRH